MYGKESKECIKETPFLWENFEGNIYNFDNFPKQINYRHSVIVHKHVQNREVEHWVLLMRIDDHSIEILNSLGAEKNYFEKF